MVTCPEWRSHAWRHRAILVGESRLPAPACILYLTGGDPHPADLTWASAVSSRSGLPVVACFDVPNQPIFDLSEDWLIAYTFERFLATGDRDWPLLNQMVRGALAVTEAASAEWGCGAWIPVGASKRAWAAWLTAAELGETAKGVIPMAFDHLAMDRQLERQVSLWGAPSPMYEPYIEYGLAETSGNLERQELLGMVDPFHRLARIECPVHLVTGASDPFWLVDASDAYWNSIRGQASSLFLANTGHALPATPAAIGSIARFAAACAAGEHPPKVEVEAGTARVSGLEPSHAWVWTAGAETHWFVESRWRPTLVEDLSTLPRPDLTELYTATFLEVFGEDESGPFSVSSRPMVLRGENQSAP